MAEKALNTLIRLNRLDLDEKRRALAELQNAAARAEALIAQQDRELASEKRIAEGSDDARVVFPAYVKANRARRAAFVRQLAELNLRIDKARDEVAVAFEAVKRYELARDAREAARLAELDHKERLQFDEIGQIQHQRRKSSESD